MIIDQQLKNNDCGISAVKTIFNRFDVPIDRSYIQQNIFLDHNGSRITDLQTFFVKHNFKAAFKMLDINYLNGNIEILKDHFPFILPVKKSDSKSLHYVIVNSLKGKKLEILDPAKAHPYYVSLNELKTIAHFSNSYWDLIQLQEKLCIICNEELQLYKIDLDRALTSNTHATLFNKLTYFSFVKENFSLKDFKAEKEFLADLIFNQEISSLPKHFRSVKYEKGKAKIKAPLVLSVRLDEDHIAPVPAFEKSTNIYLTLFRKLDGKRALFYKFIFAAFFSALTTYCAIFTNQILIDNVLPSYQMSTLVVFAIGIAIFKVFDLLTTLYKSFVGIHLSNLLDVYFLGAFDKKVNSSTLSYIQSFRKADLTERLGDALKLKTFFIKTCTRLLIDGFIGIYSLIALFYFNWRLSLMICGVIALFFVWFKVITPYLREIERTRFVLKANFVSKLLEKLDGVQVIKSFKIEQFFSTKLYTGFKELLRLQVRSKYIGILNISVVSLVTIGASLAILVFLTKGVIQDNSVTLGQMVTFLALSGRIFSSFRNLLDESLGLQENTVILKRYLDFEEQGEQVTAGTGIQDFTIRSIELDNVSFGYYPTELILKNVNLNFSLGDKIKIEGLNGSGKSTLSKLLTLLFEPTGGTYHVNGVDKKFYDWGRLREKLLLVTNEDILFNDTIEFNIAFDKHFSTSKIIELAKQIQLYEFIASKEDGLGFVISENGKNLSTGQRKKILLMRALCSPSEVIILDEVLSGMDSYSRDYVERFLNTIENKIIIVISHETVSQINFTKKYRIKDGELSL